MKFDEFVDIIPRIQRVKNPGIEAHAAVMSVHARERIKAMYQDENPRLSAVAAIVSKNVEGDAQFYLIERQTYNGTHSGQISFPGGKMDQTDPDLEYTARRETFEEIGVSENDLSLVKSLTNVYIPPSRFLVHPYLFSSEKIASIKLNQREVKSLITCSIDQLLDDSIFEIGAISISEGMKIKTGYFLMDGHKVWGATALILNEIKEIFKTIL